MLEIRVVSGTPEAHGGWGKVWETSQGRQETNKGRASGPPMFSFILRAMGSHRKAFSRRRRLGMSEIPFAF